MKRVNGHHRQNDTSVLELDTPIQNYKDTYGQEAYEQATSFYESEEWKKVERDQLNSDRRYYENRKACSLEEYNEWESAEARKHRFQDTPSVVLSAERKVTNGFDDLFDDPVLREAMEVLTEKQYSALYCSFKSRLDTYGNVIPCQHDVRKGSDYAKQSLELLEMCDTLEKRLSADDKKLLNNITDMQGMLSETMVAESYIQGFRDCAEFIIDVMFGSSENLK